LKYLENADLDEEDEEGSLDYAGVADFGGEWDE
jgi:hypothetical protein